MTENLPHIPNDLNRLPLFENNSEIAKSTIEMLQLHIQTITVNPPGNELILAKIIKTHFDSLQYPFVETYLFEDIPTRANLVVIIRGTDSAHNESWGFASHLDVVPVNEHFWSYPPFAGKIIPEQHDQFIWGRGALDMKQVGVSYIIAVTTLLKEGFRPKGDIKLIFEADEETGGKNGMKILVENHWATVKVDYLITEGGGFKLPIKNDFIIQIGEKGICQTRIKAKGVAGHGSTPEPYEHFALYKLMKVLQRIQDRPQKLYFFDEFYQTVENISLPSVAKFLLKRKILLRPLLGLVEKITQESVKKVLLPVVTDTIVPTILHAGNKENVVDPEAELTLDIRTLPNHDREFIYRVLKQKFGAKLYSELEFTPVDDFPCTTSPINTAGYQKIERVFKELCPKAKLVPLLGVGSTDMKYFRKRKVHCYGFVPLMKDPDLSYSDLSKMSHSHNERISVSNLMISVEFAYRLMKSV
jgi:acetylornithine deacetylase/succinyl-diaminopimelate desuccinylase-like protein